MYMEVYCTSFCVHVYLKVSVISEKNLSSCTILELVTHTIMIFV